MKWPFAWRADLEAYQEFSSQNCALLNEATAEVQSLRNERIGRIQLMEGQALLASDQLRGATTIATGLREELVESRRAHAETKDSADRAWERAERERIRAESAESRVRELTDEIIRFARDREPVAQAAGSSGPVMGKLTRAAYEVASVRLGRPNRLAMRAKIFSLIAGGADDEQIAHMVEHGEVVSRVTLRGEAE